MNKKVVAIASALVVLGGSAIGAVFLLDPAGFVATQKETALKTVSDALGRKVEMGAVEGHIGTALTASIKDIRVRAAVESDPAFVEVGEVELRFSLWRALTSFGRNLEVESFTIDNAVVRIGRDVNGRYSFQDIIDKGSDAPQTPPSDSDAPIGIRVARAALRNARVEIDDQQLGRKLSVHDIQLATSLIAEGEPLTATLGLVFDDQKSQTKLDATVKTAALGNGFAVDPDGELALQVKTSAFDLARWSALLPPDVVAPVAGVIGIDVDVAQHTGGSPLNVTAKLDVKGLQLRDAFATTTQTATLDVTADVALMREGDVVTLQRLLVQGTGIDAKGNVVTHASQPANVSSADLVVNIAAVERVLAVLPPSLGLGDGTQLTGALALVASVKGDALDVKLDADALHVLVKGEDGAAVFDKQARQPLHLKVKGKRSPTVLQLSEVALQLDTAQIAGKIDIPLDDKTPFTADIHSGALALSTLQGVLPPFRAAIARGDKILGTLALDVVAQAAGNSSNVKASVVGKDLDVRLDRTTLAGVASINLDVTPAGDTTSLLLSSNFDGLSVTSRDEAGAVAFEKSARTPLRLTADVKKTPRDATIGQLLLQLGNSTIKGTGGVKGLDQKVSVVDVDFGQVALAFDDLRQTVPQAKDLPTGGKLRAGVKLGGSTDVLNVDVSGLDIAFGKSSIKGRVNVKNTSAPVLDVELSQVDVAFDDVPAIAENTDLKRGGRFAGSASMKGNTKQPASVETRVKIDALALPLSSGTSNIKGAISLKNPEQPHFALGLEADFLDVDALKATFGGDEPEAKTPAKPKGKDNPHGLADDVRASLRGINGKGTIKAARARLKGAALTDFKGVLVMKNGRADFETLEFGIYGGKVSATGTSLDLPQERLGYHLDFAGDNLDLGAFLADQTSLGRALRGTVSPKLDVKGRGIAPGDFAITAEGPAKLKFRDLRFDALDLLGPIGASLDKAKKIPGLKTSAAMQKGTSFEPFTAVTRFIGGKLQLEEPIVVETSAGKLKLTGGAKLDSTLDFDAIVDVPPAFVAKLSGGKITVKDAIPVPLKIGGTWLKPQVSGVDTGPLLNAMLKVLGKAVLDDAADKAKDQVEDSIKKGGKKAAEATAKSLLDSAQNAGGKKDKKDDKKKKKAADKAKDVVKGLIGR